MITLIHYTRQAIFDYVNLESIWDKVINSDNYIAMAVFALAMSVFTLAYALVFAYSIH